MYFTMDERKWWRALKVTETCAYSSRRYSTKPWSFSTKASIFLRSYPTLSLYCFSKSLSLLMKVFSFSIYFSQFWPWLSSTKVQRSVVKLFIESILSAESFADGFSIFSNWLNSACPYVLAVDRLLPVSLKLFWLFWSWIFMHAEAVCPAFFCSEASASSVS